MADNEIAPWIMRLAGTKTPYRTYVPKPKRAVKNLQKPVDDLKKPVDDLKKPVDDLKKPVDDLKKPVDDLKKPVDDLKKPVDDLKKPVDAQKDLQGAETPAEKLESKERCKFYDAASTQVEEKPDTGLTGDSQVLQPNTGGGAGDPQVQQPPAGNPQGSRVLRYIMQKERALWSSLVHGFWNQSMSLLCNVLSACFLVMVFGK